MSRRIALAALTALTIAASAVGTSADARQPAGAPALATQAAPVAQSQSHSTAGPMRARSKQLTISAGDPDGVDYGETATSKVTVRNGSRRTLRHVVLKASAPAPATAKLKAGRKARDKVVIKQLPPRGKAKFTLLTNLRNGDPTVPVRLTAKARGAKATRTVSASYNVGQSSRSFVKRAFFASVPNLGTFVISFPDATWINAGIPVSSWPTCNPPDEYCARYTYDPTNPYVIVGSEHIPYLRADDVLVFRGTNYHGLMRVPDGTRVEAEYWHAQTYSFDTNSTGSMILHENGTVKFHLDINSNPEYDFTGTYFFKNGLVHLVAPSGEIVWTAAAMTSQDHQADPEVGLVFADMAWWGPKSSDVPGLVRMSSRLR